MNKAMTLMTILLLLAAAGVAYIRFAPSDPAQWHIDLVNNRPAELPFTLFPPGSDLVVAKMNGAYADLFLDETAARATLLRLDEIALATPRTQRLAGNPSEGHVTWVSRSAVWGFPDYTTAQINPTGIAIYARQRFGNSALGVNATRLRTWLASL